MGEEKMELLQTGKLAVEFLEKLLGKIEITDKRVVVGPGIGEDAAALDMGEQYLIVKSDPITFAAERIGWYAVNVNANDIAAMGGTPRWFLVTILLPEKGTTPASIERIMNDLKVSCAELGISLIGGHTEVTHGLKYPILSGAMLGEAKKDELIKNGNIEKGDLLYITKGVAIEGTSIIAREKKEEVTARFGEDFYKKCLLFLQDPGISVLNDARLATCSAKVTGMHDPTEGGVLAGAYEMAVGSGIGLDLYPEKIPVFEETKKLCDYFKLSPYSLIASGSLLIAVSQNEGGKIESAFDAFYRKKGSLSLIGEFIGMGEQVYLVEDGQKTRIHPTGRDEITKIFTGS